MPSMKDLFDRIVLDFLMEVLPVKRLLCRKFGHVPPSIPDSVRRVHRGSMWGTCKRCGIDLHYTIGNVWMPAGGSNGKR